MGFWKYFKIFLIIFAISLFLMSVDNIFWITASPEWNAVHTVSNFIGTWEGKVSEFTFDKMISYVFGYRIFTVWTHYRDISASLVTSFFITFGIFLYNKFTGKTIFRKDLFKKKKRVKRKRRKSKKKK